ncbi:FAD-binding oxidoreductase [Luethyella okanaganae]|uniref:FAD-binding oxidoreductase n=1 Tax=Luethyella okanaganae TaxID=69372 RepID=A0ABW1VJV1_9MICO
MDVVQRLRGELGEAVSTDVAALTASRRDRSGWTSDGVPLAVVRPTEVAEVQAVMRLASATRTPVVPRGTGTGLAGGAAGTVDSIVLDLSRMDRILEIRADDELAVVQAGVINQALDDALAPLGLWFAPDPASKAISSIGGNIATNAGGLLCAKYGVTREAVLGLAVVLADGRLIRTGHRTVKGVTGYDLTGLLTGSEGTLGVIVEATVRVRPLPVGEVATIGAFFADVAAAAAAAAAITAARLRPAVMEILDGAALSAITRYLGQAGLAGTPLARLSSGSTTEASYLLVQCDGASAGDEAAEVLVILGSLGAEARLSASREEGERLLRIRRSFHPALAAEGEVLIEDVSVPRSRMAEMFRQIAAIGERFGVAIPTVAHAGDGNLHPNFVFGGGEVPEHVWAAADELFRAALTLGGTLTGEHGVGVLKRRWLAEELGDDGYELQRRLKEVFDPLGILNPGKMFD